MSKTERLTMPQFAVATGRSIAEVKQMVSDGRIPTSPGRFLGRNEIGEPIYAHLIDPAEIGTYAVPHESSPTDDPLARRQTVLDGAIAARRIEVQEEIDASSPETQHARAMQRWQEHNREALRALGDMDAAARRMGDGS